MAARTMGDAKQERDIRGLGVREISRTRSRGASAWLADRNRDCRGITGGIAAITCGGVCTRLRAVSRRPS